ncbi:hypothetical protein OAV85_04050 [Candidatus Nanopelagicales bacterium]|nr:hypothetical protein [Candidatus Nanopelagicales bacterium]
MTIAVVSSCTTATYWPFLVPWAHAITHLNVTPDEIVIASDAPAYIQDTVNSLLPVRWIQPERTWTDHAAYIVNDAIAATTSEWIAKMDIDDRARPEYLDGLNSAECDVWCVGYAYLNHDHYISDLTPEVIRRSSNNLLASCSPFRRWLWERQEWPDALFDDWIFWLRAAKAGARFCGSHTIGYEYTSHRSQFSRRLDHALAQQQVAAERW